MAARMGRSMAHSWKRYIFHFANEHFDFKLAVRELSTRAELDQIISKGRLHSQQQLSRKASHFTVHALTLNRTMLNFKKMTQPGRREVTQE